MENSLFGVSSPSFSDDAGAANDLVAQLKKEPELPIQRDLNKNYWVALTAKNLSGADTPDDV